MLVEQGQTAHRGPIERMAAAYGAFSPAMTGVGCVQQYVITGRIIWCPVSMAVLLASRVHRS